LHIFQGIPETLEGKQGPLERVSSDESPVYTSHTDFYRESVAVDNAIDAVPLVCDEKVEGIRAQIDDAYAVHKMWANLHIPTIDPRLKPSFGQKWLPPASMFPALPWTGPGDPTPETPHWAIWPQSVEKCLLWLGKLFHIE
jgi:hypothetical protein